MGVVGVIGVIGCGDRSWYVGRIIVAACAGLLCWVASRGLLRELTEDELECLRGTDFLTLVGLGLAMSISMFSLTGPGKIYTILTTAFSSWSSKDHDAAGRNSLQSLLYSRLASHQT